MDIRQPILLSVAPSNVLNCLSKIRCTCGGEMVALMPSADGKPL